MATIKEYREVEARMCAKADRDSRAYWIGRALGCSTYTMRHLDERCGQSHRAWERASEGVRRAVIV